MNQPKPEFTRDFAEKVAEVCHAANAAFCLLHGDTSHKPWSQLSEEIKESAVDGVVHAFEHPGVSPRGMFEEWKRHKLEAGWSFGPKDVERKTHPNLVDYAELSPVEKAKDFIFLSVCHAMFAAYGLAASEDSDMRDFYEQREVALRHRLDEVVDQLQAEKFKSEGLVRERDAALAKAEAARMDVSSEAPAASSEAPVASSAVTPAQPEPDHLHGGDGFSSTGGDIGGGH